METFPAIMPSPELTELPSFDNVIINYGNKVEQRISKSVSPRWEFTIQYRTLSDTNKEIIQDFFIARKGNFESFILNHPRPSQVIGTNGSNYTAKITHLSDSNNRPITGVNWSDHWELGGERGILWVTGRTYKKEYIVRFKQSQTNFEYFTWMLWRYSSVEFIEVDE